MPATTIEQTTGRTRFFYGWVIVAVGFFAHIASAFSISSTLSVFLKPLSQDLGLSRGAFSLIRSGEILIGAAAAPLVGTLLDRHGGRWLMAAGGLVSGVGFLLLGQARDFWQFAAVRWLLVSPGDALMGSLVVNVSISQWFVRMRGRALALAGMGHGLAKVCMPVAGAALMLYVGWRGVWVVFGLLTFALVVGPALLLMRRRPEDMGLRPDGAAATEVAASPAAGRRAAPEARAGAAGEVAWSRREALRTSAFWLIVLTFGVSHVGVTGLNLHVFSFVTDQGHSSMVAAFVMSVIAVMQFSTPMVWGVLAERVNVARLIMAKFLVQAMGILLALSDPGLFSLYAGFFLYGIGMGGTAILAEVIWANYFGRLTLGKIRGMGSLLTSLFSAGGPPFFGLLFDATQSYELSFGIFIAMLFASAGLSFFLRPPRKIARAREY
ncbi:MAG TPA: MFS transporter [candidate division Zixibacteria bacterium]|nr:MFS transporter [candidate division Zixibacteria bacterium]